MKKLLFLFPLLVIISCSDADNPYGARINNRGCLECDNYTAGEAFILKGVRYEVADRAMLITAIDDDEDLTRYCTSRIGDMSGLFEYNQSFNQDISSWDVSNVTNMSKMFRGGDDPLLGFPLYTSFDQDIGNWDVSNVTNMTSMFHQCFFNQNLSEWCVSNISTLPIDFSNGLLSPSNHPVWGTCP